MKSQAGPHNGQVSIGVGGMTLDVSLDPSSFSPLTSTGITWPVVKLKFALGWPTTSRNTWIMAPWLVTETKVSGCCHTTSKNLLTRRACAECDSTFPCIHSESCSGIVASNLRIGKFASIADRGPRHAHVHPLRGSLMYSETNTPLNFSKTGLFAKVSLKVWRHLYNGLV